VKNLWERLAALRAVFLGEADGRRSDYWDDEELLDAYDRFFGERIRCKWRAVLDDAKRRGFDVPRGARVVDWGCGTGVAARAFLDAYPDRGATIVLFDRSWRATRFAARRCADRAVVDPVVVAPDLSDALVLLSHVANELDAIGAERLVESLRTARAVIWVEPGTPEASATLVGVREQLRRSFHIVAPCTHRERCGTLAPENARHWCHFFAPPDPGVFQSAEWRQFSERLRVDLRSLPTSFLVLDREAPPWAAPGSLRIVGRARVYNGYATFLACGAAGLREEKLRKRDDPKRWKRFREAAFADYGEPVPLPE
jgi:SAM-dependent methyltransferase